MIRQLLYVYIHTRCFRFDIKTTKVCSIYVHMNVNLDRYMLYLYLLFLNTIFKC